MKNTPDSNEKNAVDKLFRKALANYEAEASATAYQKWQAEMARLNNDNDKRRGWIWWTLPALLVAGIATGGGYWYVAGTDNAPLGNATTEIVVSTEKFENAKQPSESLPHLTTEKAREEVPQELTKRVTATVSDKRQQQLTITPPDNARKQQAEVMPVSQETTGEQSLPITETVEQSAVMPAAEEKLQLEVFIRLGSEASAKGSAAADAPSAEAVEESNLKRLWKRLNGKEVARDTSEKRIERRILGYPADSLFKKKDKRKTQD